MVFLSCKKEKEAYRFIILPEDKTGVSFENTLKDTPDLNILTYLYYYNGAGLAIGDFNNDQLEDVFFVSNQGSNQLYINQGSLQFVEKTPELLKDDVGWSTGVTVIDINNDGLLDIYLCKVGSYKNIKGKNKLFINQGVGNNGIPSFKEEAAKYNLDISSFSTQASFFDYDLDGDLDMYLLNHSVYPNRTYGRGSKRKQIDTLSGDRLFQNDNGLYRDVSKQAGIFQGTIGYGLGISVSDVNNDNYPDIYIGNDFFENDYLYINQKDGTFTEIITSAQDKVHHTSHFSMGVDIADINNDGLTDILSLDMLPEDLVTYKSSGTEHPFSIYNQYLKNGYHPQYMQNALQLNQGNNHFNEIAFYAGVAATEWSWAPLIADYDNDGFKDIFISNGIKGATNDMDFISFIANDNIQNRINKGMNKEDLALINELPKKKTVNYFYQNNKDVTFTDVSHSWAKDIPSYSNGAAYVDLDNDGDLDLITNNVNEKAFIYENKSEVYNQDNNYIKIKLRGDQYNPEAIGAKVSVYAKNKKQVSEVYRTRGYLSSVSSVLHFGLGSEIKIDSIEVLWPGGLTSVKKNVNSNQYIQIDNEKGKVFREKQKMSGFLKKDTIALTYKHKDFETKDFSIEPLAPYSVSNEGPHITVVDANKDGFEDVYIPGGRFEPASLFLQRKDGSFEKSKQPDFLASKSYEDIIQCFLDVDQDGDLDLITGYGGNESFQGYQSPPALFINENGVFKKQEKTILDDSMNTSIIISSDIDQDGDQDLFIGSNTVTGKYGAIPKSYLLKNLGQGDFEEVASGLELIGQVYDAVFIDVDKDGYEDLVLAGHYMPITILFNDGKGNFKNGNIASLQHTNGWWNTIKVHDMDQDGDLDIIAGNWGLNTRLQASDQEPIQLYLADFDRNGKIDPIVTYFYKGKETTIATKDELSKQIPLLNKKFLSYNSFATANFEDYFSNTIVSKADKKKVFTLATTYFENKGNFEFETHELPREAQISSVHDILINDINNDGFWDIILGGNTYEINTQLSRLDGSYGVVLINDTTGDFYSHSASNIKITGAVRSIKNIKINNKEFILFAMNNDSLQVLKKIK